MKTKLAMKLLEQIPFIRTGFPAKKQKFPLRSKILQITLLVSCLLFFSHQAAFSQGATCAEATQLCDSPACGTFDVGSGQGNDPIAGESSSCVGGDPNATWFFLIDDQGGGGSVTITNNPGLDTDFVAWGPFASPADALGACNGGISTANEVGCDFTTAPGGTINMPASSQVGDVYLMVITNFSNQAGITVNVTAPPLQCCPVPTGVKADVDICSGGTATSAITEFEGTPGEVTGATQFLSDLGTSTSNTAAVAPTAADFMNATCDPITLTLYHLFECDEDCDGVGDGPSVAGSFDVTIYPDASTWMVTETPGTCGMAATVVVAAGGTTCLNDTGTVPPPGTCPATNGEAPLNYSLDPGFPVACNMVFTGTVAATCAPTGCCPDCAGATAADLVMQGCDDGDPCTENDMEQVVGCNTALVCMPCAGTPVAACTGAVANIVQACDDGDPCTENDMEELDGCDGATVCVPCAGTPVAACTGAVANIVQGCDDGDPCTENDVEELDGCDGSVCVPCAGELVGPPIPSLTCPPTTLDRCNGDPYDCMFSDQNTATAAMGTEASPIIGGPDAGVVSSAGIIDPLTLAAGSYTFTLTYESPAGCIAPPVTCTFTVAEPPKGSNAGSLGGN